MARIDWGHPLAQGLAAYVPGLEGGGLPIEAVTRTFPDGGLVLAAPSTTTNFWSENDSSIATQLWPKRYTPVLAQGLSPGATWSDALTRLAGMPEGRQVQLTAAMVVQVWATAASAMQLWGKGLLGGSATGWSLGKDASQRYFFGIGTNLATVPTALTLFRTYVVIGRCRYPDMNLKVVRLADDALSGLPPTFTEAATQTIIGTPADAAAGSPLNFGQRASTNRASLSVAAMWKRYLADEELDWWYDDPWAMLEQSSGRRFFLPVAAPAAPGLISPTAIASAEAFGTAIIQGAIIPTGIVSSEAIGANLHIGDITPTAIASAEAFGTAYVFGGDIGPTGIVTGEFVNTPDLLDTPGAAGTIDLDTGHTGIATGEAVGSHTVREEATISPTGIPSGFDMDNPTLGAPVGTIQPFGIASAEAFGTGTGGGTGSVGSLTVFTLTNPNAPAPGTVTAKKLCSPFNEQVLALAIAGAPTPADILPDVYGDFTDGGLRGPCPTVLVTTTAPFLFVAASHPVQSIDKVYVDDVEQTGGFATSPAFPLGALQIAIIAFGEQPLGQVTWRGKGKMDAAGALITDPILQLEDMLLIRGGYAVTDFEATTLAAAKAASTAAGWSQAWIFNDTRPIQEWITEVLFNVMGFWRVNGRAQLQLYLDPGGTPATADLVASIVANRDCVDGDDGVSFIADRQQLVNKLVANYRWSWGEGRYTEQLGGGLTGDVAGMEDFVSSNAYGELRKEVTLRGHRDPLQIVDWAAILFERQAFDTRVEGGLVNFRVKGPQLIHATVGDVIAFSWPYGPTREMGNPYVNQILRITQINHDFTQGGISDVTAVDTGGFVADGGGLRILEPLAL
jgi:hypothetical protein